MLMQIQNRALKACFDNYPQNLLFHNGVYFDHISFSSGVSQHCDNNIFCSVVFFINCSLFDVTAYITIIGPEMSLTLHHYLILVSFKEIIVVRAAG